MKLYEVKFPDGAPLSFILASDEKTAREQLAALYPVPVTIDQLAEVEDGSLILPANVMAPIEPHVYRHKKRGSSYRVFGEARVQCETLLVDNDRVLVYRDIHSLELSVRSPAEFRDGRFEVVS